MEKEIRRLARSYYWQNIYIRGKEISNLHLFANSYDFTKIQVLFLSWLEIYRRLYQDLANEENYISEEVIKDDLRTDSYLLYKNKYKGTIKDKKHSTDKLGKIPSVVFKRKT